MAKDWRGVAGTNAQAWGIPAAALQELDGFIQAADAALATAKNETTRTPVAMAQCRAAFEALTAKIRDFKKRYFLSPPLADADYIALGLKPRHRAHPKRAAHGAGNGGDLSCGAA
jgi:hypothetical protein